MSFSGILREGGRERRVAVTVKGGVLRGSVDGSVLAEAAVERRGARILVRRGGRTVQAIVARDGERLQVHLDGRVHEYEISGARVRRERGARRAAGADDAFAASPMTGTVAEVTVKPGDAVAKGGTLAVVEAMKMQFVVRAPRAVTVKAVRVVPGQPVDIGAVLVEFGA